MTPTYATHTFLVLSALLLGVVACTPPSGDLGHYPGPDEETRGEAETTGGSTSATPTETTMEGEPCPFEEAADQCCCFAQAKDCWGPTQVLCEATVACEDIQVVNGDDKFVENPAAVECALTALRDRTPGQIRVMYRWGESEPVTGWTFFYVGADGTVFANHGNSDGDPEAHELVRRSLPPAEVFEQCLLEPDPAARLECVKMATYGGDLLESCLPRCDFGQP